MSGWITCLEEAAAVAVATGRILVEPCVRGGALVACVPGAVESVPDGLSAEAVAAVAAGGHDPLAALPQFREGCAGSKRTQWSAGRAFPLHAYLHRGWLAGLLPGLRVASVEEWAEARLASSEEWARAGGAPTDAWGRPRLLHQRGEGIALPLGLRGVVAEERKLWVPCDEAVVLMPWRVGRVLCCERRVGSYTAALQAASLAEAPEGVIFAWYREPGLARTAWPPFNPLHAAALAAWGRGRPTAVLQWRSAGAVTSVEVLAACGAHLSRVLARLPKLAPPAIARVLVADLPAPDNPCDVFHELDRTPALQAARRTLSSKFSAQGWRSLGTVLAEEGARNASATTLPTDAGVLAVRDALIASTAQWYITCDGGWAAPPERQSRCRECYFASAYIHRTVLTREALGRESNLVVWDVHNHTLVP